MPQSSKQMRKRWGGAQGIGDDKAVKYLESKGYTLTDDFCWKKPSKDHEVTVKEADAMLFLIEEWDYGPTTK